MLRSLQQLDNAISSPRRHLAPLVQVDALPNTCMDLSDCFRWPLVPQFIHVCLQRYGSDVAVPSLMARNRLPLSTSTLIFASSRLFAVPTLALRRLSRRSRSFLRSHMRTAPTVDNHGARHIRPVDQSGAINSSLLMPASMAFYGCRRASAPMAAASQQLDIMNKAGMAVYF